MPNYRLVLRLAKNTEIHTEFETIADLNQRLAELDEIVKTVSSKSDIMVTLWEREPREVKPQISHLCRFIIDNQLEWLQRTKFAGDGVAIAVYAYDPIPLTTSQIQQIVGIDNASPYLTGAQYKEYYISKDEKYILSFKGREWVETEVLKDYPKPGPESAESSNSG
jgi:hypothetical protein